MHYRSALCAKLNVSYTASAKMHATKLQIKRSFAPYQSL